MASSRKPPTRKPPTPEPEATPAVDPLSQGIGSVAEEAAKLLAALGSGSRAKAGEPATCEHEHEHEHHPPAGEAIACRLCPLCQGIALLRGLHPETIDRLADLAAAAAGALRDLAEQSVATRAAAPAPRSSGAGSRRVDIEVDGDEEVPS